MQIRFKTSVADEHSSFMVGRVVTFDRLPIGWEHWLEAGIIEILPSAHVERAEVPQAVEAAVVPQTRRRRGGHR